MADTRFSDSTVPRGGNEKVEGSTHFHSYTAGAVLNEVPIFSKRDIDTVKLFEADAEKLLGKLDIDHNGSVSRNEILKAESKPALSEHGKQIYDGLNNLEPSIQEAWQVPNHRQHLQLHSNADFYRSAAQLMLKKGDKSWADELNTEAAKVDGPAKAQLAKDRVEQKEVFFNQGGVTKETLNQLKEQIKRVEAATEVMPMSGKVAMNLLKRFDANNKGITATDLAKIVAVKDDKHLSDSDRAVMQGIIDYEKPDRMHVKLSLTEITEAVRGWVVKEKRADYLGSETLFARALNGYQGTGLDVHTEERFNREMESKDASQLNEDERAHNYTRVPHFPKS